ncbi:GDSL-type esterase/lipase family protein [Bacteroides sp. MSB163]|uniref:GDSL-type esterase/lipase family protein n=1 Tax=Bacteroides maternus TaxID=3117552 RepID=UPI002ED9C332
MKSEFMHFLLFLLFPVISLPLMAQTASPQKVACVGNSITAGVGLHDRNHDSYPMVLARMLGKEYEVRNFGVSGRTMVQKGQSYMKEKAFEKALDYRPDILIVKLGTNDTNPPYWKYKNDYMNDMNILIHAFKKRNPEVKVYLCYPVAIYSERFREREEILVNELIPMIDKVAKQNDAETIDLHTPTQDIPDAFFDNIHPNEKGARIIAREICKALTRNVTRCTE